VDQYYHSDSHTNHQLLYTVDILRGRYPSGTQVEAMPFIWGQDVQPLLSSTIECAHSTSSAGGKKFDVLILADLLFNRSEHAKLLKTCKECMADDGTAWITYSHHDPEKAALDRNFFKLAIEEPYNFKVTKVQQQQLVDLFVCNDGMDKARGVVYLYHLEHGGTPDQVLDLFPEPDLSHLNVTPS
jgi:nicotinamide N-methyltransferase